MRSLPLMLVGFAGIALAAPVAGQRSDDQIAPKSLELQHQAKELVGTGKLEQAEDLLETALARVILKEEVDWQRWVGATVVACGVGLLALP